MATLFVLSHAPHSDPPEGNKLAFAGPGDAAILIEDAVYGAADIETPLSATLREAIQRGIDIYVLDSDRKARGLETSVATVDYEGFVELITDHERAVH